MKDADGYLTVVREQGDGWIDTAIAIEVGASRLYPAVRRHDSLALVNEWSTNGVNWQRRQPFIGGRQRVVVLRRNTRQAEAAVKELTDVLAADHRS